jgi:hypothetical protein
MIGTITPVKKIGNLLVRPNWRYDALFNPGKYKLKEFVARNVPANSGALNRYITLGLPYEVNMMPSNVKYLLNNIAIEHQSIFLTMWNRHLKRNHIKKVNVDFDQTKFQKVPLWNLKKINNINDAFIIRMIKHISNYEFDQHIAYAFELGRNSDYNEIFKFIGYCIYAKVSDKDIAVRWNIPIKHVEAIRLMFFDFSSFPKDRLANISYLRQLTNIGLFTDVDFAYFKRVFELGELALKAQTDFYSLTSPEKKLIEEYLGKTLISNTLNLHFAVKNQRDAVEYGLIVSNLASYYIKTAEATYFESKIRNLDAATRRIEGDLKGSDSTISELDKEFMTMLNEHSLQDEKLEYKTLDSLK